MSRGLKNSSARNIRWKWVQLAHTPARRQFIRAPMRQKSNPCMKGPSKDYTWSCGPAWGLPVMPESHQAVCTSWVLDVCGRLKNPQTRPQVSCRGQTGSGCPAALVPQRSTSCPGCYQSGRIQPSPSPPTPPPLFGPQSWPSSALTCLY